jgi:hypothetical protein
MFGTRVSRVDYYGKIIENKTLVEKNECEKEAQFRSTFPFQNDLSAQHETICRNDAALD